MQGHIQQESGRKNYWTLVGLFNSTHHIHSILHQAISIFSLLYKILWITPIISRRSDENVFEKFLERKFYLRGINKQEVIQNNGKYAID